MSNPQMGSPVSRSELFRERYKASLPSRLDDLTGPAQGVVQLPLHLAWSGMTAFAVDQPKLCASMYYIVLLEGQRHDIIAYVNRDLLISNWPILRKLADRILREVWESAFPELKQTAVSEDTPR